jgi:hypothetical protein
MKRDFCRSWTHATWFTIVVLVLNSQSVLGGQISGRTVRLNPADTVDNVDIVAFQIDANGNRTDNIVGSTRSRAGGNYTLVINSAGPVEVDFQQNGINTTLQRIVGGIAIAGFDVVVPEGIAARAKPCEIIRAPCCRRRLSCR